ncbi:AbiH family protein [Chryseobacterium sp.]|uniref:AbiH family protein n=1 Tax=Chryseobacterium sp. TaxID=1871047 RepID=UPI000EE23C65|nr:AbiH family protein [Chryseobacterium sp.]HCA06275.1 hypothetical protein [Chryseobacterium sp.]
MNRLVIIGNGFDLAHGLPTSYSSFLNFIWKEIRQASTNPLFQNLFQFEQAYFPETFTCESYKDFQNKITIEFNLGKYSLRYPENRSTVVIFYKESLGSKSNKIFEFRNRLFELICEESAKNWVDIENIYYQVLISIAKGDGKYTQFRSIDKLNSEFNVIKQLLDYYLNTYIEQKYSFENSYIDCTSIISLFEYEYKNLSSRNNHEFFLEFPPDYRETLIEFDKMYDSISLNYKNNVYENLFLDFNYTSNVDNYVSILEKKNEKTIGRSSQIQIHGHVSSSENPINFGFGDEMDDHYKILENTGDNKYLENIKSFMYFNNSNYRKLLNWIETKDYQVFIMGHSCGLSDRTLLNTLFEHPNCKSIKIFYHQKADGTDNFTELSQNISRHFNKKSMMRQKVVDKSLSKPLPQDVRYTNKIL